MENFNWLLAFGYWLFASGPYVSVGCCFVKGKICYYRTDRRRGRREKWRRVGETTINRDTQDIQDGVAAGVWQTPCVSAFGSFLDASICGTACELTRSREAGSAVRE